MEESDSGALSLNPWIPTATSWCFPMWDRAGKMLQVSQRDSSLSAELLCKAQFGIESNKAWFRMFCTVWIPARDSHFTHNLWKQQPCCGSTHPCFLTTMPMAWQRTASTPRNTASRVISGKLGLIKDHLHALILTQSLSKAWQQRPPQSSNSTHRDLNTWNAHYILKDSLPLIIL